MSDPTYEELKEWIDGASYEELLRRWRFAPAGDAIFANYHGSARDKKYPAIGRYYQETMAKRRAEIGDAGSAQASINVGWDPKDFQSGRNYKSCLS